MALKASCDDSVEPRLLRHGLSLCLPRVRRPALRPRRVSFCDAISFVVVTTLLDNIPCLSFDGDFKALGLTVIG